MLLTVVMAVAMIQANAQSMGTGAATGTGSSGSAINSNPNLNQPTFGSEVPNKGTTSQNATGTTRRSGNVMNNTNTTNDSVGTSQSSTTTIKTKERRVIPITPANTNATGVNCVDRSGRNFGSGDSGYTACVNSMRTR